MYLSQGSCDRRWMRNNILMLKRQREFDVDAAQADGVLVVYRLDAYHKRNSSNRLNRNWSYKVAYTGLVSGYRIPPYCI